MADWKAIIGAVAPTMATMLGGPLAGMAVKALSQGLLGKEDANINEVATAVFSGNSDVLEKIKQIDAQLVIRLRELDVDMDKVNASDRDSARKRESETKDPTTRQLALFYTLGYFVAIWAAWKFGIPPDAKDLIYVLIGGLTGAQLQILNYYFGSSSGSSAKTVVLDRLVNHK